MDNKWIETKDRLPECTEEGCSEEVLICVNGCVISGMHYWICDNIFMDEMDTVFSPSKVSHWMNLPEPSGTSGGKKEMKNNSTDYTGKRIVLIRMDDNHGHDTQVIPPMTTGIVESVDDIGQLHVRWDGINSSLAVIPEVDLFRVLPDEE